jgi:hypothetical protein
MIRYAFCLPAFLAATLFALPLAAQAQPSVPAPQNQSQLDRIEGKLDELLRRLDPPRPQPSGTVQGKGAPSPPSNSNPSLAPGGPAAPLQAEYKSGAMVIARPAPKDINSLSEVPTDNVGGFVYQGGPIALTDIRSQGVRYAGPVGVEIQGWLKAKEAGRYQIGADLNAHFGRYGPQPPTCFLQAWLEGRSLDQRSILVSRPGSNDANASLVLGAELQPGLYKLRAWMTCTSPLNVTTTAELLLKSPSELNLRPITTGDLLYREE